VDLAPLQNKWIDVELEMTIGDASTGRVRWALRDNGTTVIDVTKTGVDTFLQDRVRPKWGIYRSLGDTSGSLQDCYQLIRNMRAYQRTSSAPPPIEVQAENATISRGVVESNHTGFTGTGFVNLDNVVGSYAQFAVTAAAAGTRSLAIRFANGTTASRPMSVSVNGVVVATPTFAPTADWDTWAVATVPVTLSAGANTIRLTSTTATGGPNLDKINLT
jgi:hypothetical protein